MSLQTDVKCEIEIKVALKTFFFRKIAQAGF